LKAKLRNVGILQCPRDFTTETVIDWDFTRCLFLAPKKTIDSPSSGFPTGKPNITMKIVMTIQKQVELSRQHIVVQHFPCRPNGETYGKIPATRRSNAPTKNEKTTQHYTTTSIPTHVS
jgi:hypothetical protein